MMHAARYGQAEMLTLLIEKGGNTHIQSKVRNHTSLVLLSVLVLVSALVFRCAPEFIVTNLFIVLQEGKTALNIARGSYQLECMKVLKEGPYTIPFERVMFSLHCSNVVQEDMAGESFASSPLGEFCTDDRYRHLIESMVGMILEE